MSLPHIRPLNQTQYDTEGRAIAEEFFEVNLHTEVLNTLATYWLKRSNGGNLQPIRLEQHRALDLPPPISAAALERDSERDWQELKLYVGNDAGTATLVENDPNAKRRYRLIFRAMSKAF